MDFSNLPAPSSYEDWKSWAAMLVQQLQTLSGDTAQNFPLWVEDQGKERSGMPAGVDGDLIRVKTESGETEFRYWDKVSGSWQPVTDLSGVESQLDAGLAEKLDLDLGNLSAATWDDLFSALMPDGSKTIDISSSIQSGAFPTKSYKAPCSGWITFGANGTTNDVLQTLKQEVFADGSYSSWNTKNFTTYADAGYNWRQTFLVFKGECVGANWSGTMRDAWFMPCKGARYGESDQTI